MRSASACQHRCARPATRICRSSFLPPSNWRNICTRAWSWCWSPPPTRAPHARSCCRCWGMPIDLTVGEDWFLAFSPERVDPGREDFTTLNTPKVVGGITPACAEVASSLVWQRDPAHIPGLFGGSSRDGETAGEYLPHDQHRHGQRTGDHVRAPGCGCVGSDRRGGHQAVRLHEVHTRARAWAGIASRSTRCIFPGR